MHIGHLSLIILLHLMKSCLGFAYSQLNNIPKFIFVHLISLMIHSVFIPLLIVHSIFYLLVGDRFSVL